MWRFPKLAYENGGGSFLIPYFVILFIIGKPMYYLELALGQFSQRGPVKLWNLCPFGYGVGIGQCIVSIIVAIYYNVILGYCLYYIFASFTSEVPWAKCSSEWGLYGDISADLDTCFERGNENSCGGGDAANFKENSCQFAAKQYFDKVVLGIDKALTENQTETVDNGTATWTETVTYALTEPGNIGEIKWDITLCLLLSWTVVCLCLVKGESVCGIKILCVIAAQLKESNPAARLSTSPPPSPTCSSSP